MAANSSSSVYTHIIWGTEAYTDWEAAFLALIKVGAFGMCASNDALTTNDTRFGTFMF